MAASLPRRLTLVGASPASKSDVDLVAYFGQSNRNHQPLQAFVTGMASIGEIPVIFAHLEKVAPDDIEPDVAAVHDSFKKQIDDMGNAASNPLAEEDGGFNTNPAPDTASCPGQVLIAIGTPAELDALERTVRGEDAGGQRPPPSGPTA